VGKENAGIGGAFSADGFGIGRRSRR